MPIDYFILKFKKFQLNVANTERKMHKTSVQLNELLDEDLVPPMLGYSILSGTSEALPGASSQSQLPLS